MSRACTDTAAGKLHFRFAVILACCVLPAAPGCQLVINPFVDEQAARPTPTTPSAQVAMAHDGEDREAHRDAPSMRLGMQDGAVLHGPLYFEDPFEDKGSEDGKFAWTGEDYLQALYWRGRFLVNALMLPVSVVVTPPWVVMASDGVLSKQILWMDHDATRW